MTIESNRQDSSYSPSVRIVIVNYRTPKLTIDCLRSLEEHVIDQGIRVSLVDNCSEDGSVDAIKAAIADHGWDSWVDLLPLDVNGGFAFGNNAAIRAAIKDDSPDYFWLLNPDTIVRPDALRPLVEHLELNPSSGIAGSRLEDPDETPQRSAFRFPTLWSEIDTGLRFGPISRLLQKHVVAPPVNDKAHEIGWVAGASMLVRREVIEDIGLLDEQYFMYYEEVDFCLRAAKAGWQTWYLPQSRVVHLVGQASGITGTQKKVKRRPTYWFDSRRRYFVKNHGRAYAMLTDLSWVISFTIWRVRAFFQRKDHNDPPRLLTDFICNSSVFRGVAT